VPEFHAKAPQAIVSYGLAQGPYEVARAGVKLMTLRLKAIDSTNASPHPTSNLILHPSKPSKGYYTKLVFLKEIIFINRIQHNVPLL